jgi:hypothetical protein
MKKTLLILVCLLFLMGVAYSAVLDVGIVETLEGNISSIIYDASSNIIKLSTEFYNTGSVPYKARIKTEIFNESEMLFSGWGQENVLMSGDKKISDVYWYTNKTGDYFAKIKVYFGDKINEYKKFGFSVTSSVEAEDVFEIQNLRTYENYIIFDIKSMEDAQNVIVIPDQYTLGWVFEQVEIDEITGNSSKIVVLNYYPTVWKPSNVTLAITSDKGKYYTEKRVELTKHDGLAGLFYYIIDSLRIALFK